MRLGKLGRSASTSASATPCSSTTCTSWRARRRRRRSSCTPSTRLLADGRQVVVTCDCHPRLADDFTPELTDRLLGGAVWGLTAARRRRRGSPSCGASRGHGETPLPRRRAAPPGRAASRQRARAGRGVHSLRHYSRVTGRAVDLALAREALGDLLRHAVRVVQLADVDRAVCQALHLEPAPAVEAARWAVSHPRMVAMFLARKHTAAAYSEIGQHFGGRNHSTAVAAEKKVRTWMSDDAPLVVGDRRWRVREVIELVERDCCGSCTASLGRERGTLS